MHVYSSKTIFKGICVTHVKVFHEIKVNKHRRLKIRQSWTSPQAPWFCHLQLLPVSPLCLWRRRFRLSLLPYYCQVTFCHFFFFLFLSIYLVISFFCLFLFFVFFFFSWGILLRNMCIFLWGTCLNLMIEILFYSWLVLQNSWLVMGDGILHLCFSYILFEPWNVLLLLLPV